LKYSIINLFKPPFRGAGGQSVENLPFIMLFYKNNPIFANHFLFKIMSNLLIISSFKLRL